MKKFDNIQDLLDEFIFINFKRNYAKIKELGLYPGQEHIIDYVANHEGVSQKDICLFTGREKATVTKTIQRLILSGYISKVDDNNDKRINHLYLTKLGKSVYQKIVELKIENMTYIKSILSEEELDIVKTILIKVCNQMKGDINNEENT